MATLRQITMFLNRELNVRKIPDSSRNGLQINSKKKEIKKVAFAVDACLSTFERAKKAKADLIIVHHGLFWKPRKRSEVLTLREKYLKKNNIALYGVHLPLDLHKNYGNNIELARLLKLKNIKPFGKYHGFYIGFKGMFQRPTTLKKLKNFLDKKLKTKCNLLSFGKKSVKTIGIVSGGSGSVIPETKKEKLDVILVGEIKHSEYHFAKDLNINLIEAGHYATETWGVKALMKPLKEKFKIETIFIDNPTGI